MTVIDTQRAGHHLFDRVLEIAESALLGSLEPSPISVCSEHELPRVRNAILRAHRDGFARFRDVVNRNSFLLGCRDYTVDSGKEHLLVGYGFRYGSTTRVHSLHHVTGSSSSVCLPADVGHAMWAHYRRHHGNELLVFHNHPCNPLNLLLDNLPLPSRTDRRFLEARALQPEQIVRRLLGGGRIRFYLGENGFVKEFRLPSAVSLAARHAACLSARP